VTPDHVEDRAALYALGALADDECAAIDAHVRECSACAFALGAAEDDVALISSNEHQQSAPPELAARIDRLLQTHPLAAKRQAWRPAWRYAAAIAAALLIGLLPSAYLWLENRTMQHGVVLAQSGAMDRLAGAKHFLPTTASPARGSNVCARWFVVRGRSARGIEAALSRVDARRRAHDARRRRSERQHCDALPA
jgi:Putative zinc-finger